MRYIYPVRLDPDDGVYVVSFPDVPEALTQGETDEEALREGQDALVVALGGYVEEGRDIPASSPVAPGQRAVALPALIAAKLALYTAMREDGVTKVELARRLSVSEAVARRLVHPDHHSKIERVEDGLRALGRTLVVEAA